MGSNFQTQVDEGCEIPLTQGRVAIVDAADFERLKQFAWHAVHTKGLWYARRNTGDGQIYLHHEVAGEPPEGFVVDHRNGDGLDNRRGNLRYATQGQNVINSKSRGSKFRGVFQIGRRFVARIRAGRKSYYGGIFGCAEQAACAADALMAARHGEFARLNKVGAANDA